MLCPSTSLIARRQNGQKDSAHCRESNSRPRLLRVHKHSPRCTAVPTAQLHLYCTGPCNHGRISLNEILKISSGAEGEARPRPPRPAASASPVLPGTAGHRARRGPSRGLRRRLQRATRRWAGIAGCRFRAERPIIGAGGSGPSGQPTHILIQINRSAPSRVRGRPLASSAARHARSPPAGPEASDGSSFSDSGAVSR